MLMLWVVGLLVCWSADCCCFGFEIIKKIPSMVILEMATIWNAVDAFTKFPALTGRGRPNSCMSEFNSLSVYVYVCVCVYVRREMERHCPPLAAIDGGHRSMVGCRLSLLLWLNLAKWKSTKCCQEMQPAPWRHRHRHRHRQWLRFRGTGFLARLSATSTALLQFQSLILCKLRSNGMRKINWTRMENVSRLGKCQELDRIPQILN